MHCIYGLLQTVQEGGSDYADLCEGRRPSMHWHQSHLAVHSSCVLVNLSPAVNESMCVDASSGQD